MVVLNIQLLIGFTIIAFLSFEKVSTNELDRNGENVCTVQLSYNEYRTVRRTILTTESYETCTLFSLFGGCFFWARKTNYRAVYRQSYQAVATLKYRQVFRCCTGYQRNGTDCSTPICDDPCVHGKCTNPNQCKCFDGYSGSNCNTDVNECLANHGGCEQECRNTEGSFICDCRNGFAVSKMFPNKCEDINECLVDDKLCFCGDKENNPECESTCNNTVGEYQCQCSEGYHTSNNKICEDINECRANNGGCSKICVNTPGTYYCLCDVGYQLGEDGKTCADTNECDTNKGGCQHTCSNTDGSFSCSCDDGYFLDGNGLTCSDHDECANANHGCEYNCENKQGSYVCACQEGFKLNPDNTTCSDEDECDMIIETKTDGQQVTAAGCQHTCHNLIGSFNCSCRIGYRLLADLKTCIDFNECEAGEHLCQDICNNKQGSYECSCNDGYEMGRKFYECVGEQCEGIPLLSNGESTCNTGVTGDQCSSKCNNGFTLKGSENRWCQPNNKFNGTAVTCERRRCKEIDPLINGIVNLPCAPYFNTTCKVACADGYVLDGPNTRTCVVREDNQMEWTNPDVQCIESTICFPNPCQHSGVCQPRGHSFTCNCDGTGFTGSTCLQGIVSVPQIPVLSVNIKKRGLIIKARPDVALTIQIISNDTTLVPAPQLVTIEHPSTSATFEIFGTKTGFFTLKYKLNNTDALNSIQPKASVVFVSSNITKPVTDTALDGDGSLKEGCSTFDSNTIEGGASIRATSNTPFDSSGSSNGIVQVRGEDGELVPLSASGGRFSNDGFDAFPIQDSINSGGDSDIDNNPPSDCYSEFDPKAAIEQLLKTNAFLYSIQNMFNKHSPYWFKVQAGFVEQYDINDFKGDLVRGSEIKQNPSDCTKGFTMESNAVYYIFKTRQPFHILFPTNNITLPETVQKCFIKNLKDHNVYFAMIPLVFEKPIAMVNVSKELNVMLQKDGHTDRIGFNINAAAKKDIFYTFGSRSTSSFTINGVQSWKVKNISNILENEDLDFEQRNGTGKFTLQWKAMNSLQEITGDGNILHSSVTNLVVEDVCTNGTFTGVNFTSAKITLSEKIAKLMGISDREGVIVFTLEDVEDGIIALSTNMSELSASFQTLEIELNRLLKFFSNFQTEDPTVRSLKEMLVIGLTSLRQNTQSFISALSTSPPKSVSQLSKDFVNIRDMLTGAHKRFEILAIENKMLDGFDFTNVRYNLKLFSIFLFGFVDVFSGFKISATPSTGKVKLAHVKAVGKICLVEGYCYDDVFNELIYGPFLSQCIKTDVEIPGNSTLIITKLMHDDNFGGIFKLKANNEIHTVINPYAALYQHSFDAAWQYYSNDVANAKVTISSTGDVSITSKTDVFGDIADVRISASICGQKKMDSLQFQVKGNIAGSQKLGQEIENSIKMRLASMEENLKQRYEHLQEDVDIYKDDLQRYSFESIRNQDALKVLENQLEEINTTLTEKEAMISTLKIYLQESTDAQDDLIKNYYSDCQPSLCLTKCIPGIVVNACQSKQDVYKLEHDCKLIDIARMNVDFVQNTVRNSYIDLESRFSCYTKCPPLTEFFRKLTGKTRKRRAVGNVIVVAALVKTFQEAGGTEGAIGAFIGGVIGGPIGGIAGGVIGSAFGSCDKRCTKKQTPKITYYNVTTILRQLINSTEKISKCENVLKRYEVQGYETTACLQNSTCSDIHQDTQCATKQKQCSEKVAEIKSLHNKTVFDSDYLNYQKEVYLLDLLKKRRDVVNRSLTSKKAESEIVNNTLKLVAAIIQQTNNQIDKFNKTFEKQRLLIQQFKQHDDFVKIKNINYSHYNVHGSKFPDKLLLDISLETKDSRAQVISTMFVLDDRITSIDDAASEIIEVVTSVSTSNLIRRRRSLYREPTSTHLQRKCLQIESDVLFLTNFLNALKKEIDSYAASITKIASSNIITANYFNNIKTIATDSEIDGNLGSELNLLQAGFLSAASSLRWNETFAQFLLRYSHSISNQTECFSLRDCIYLKLDTIKELFKYVSSNFTMSVKEDIKIWTETFPKVIINGVAVKEMQKVVADTYATFINTNAMSWYCGDKPILNGTLTGETMHLKEGDDLKLTLLVKNKIHETNFEWTFDKAVITNISKGTLMLSSITKYQTGWYSCKATNKFGTSECGIRKVIVYSKPTVYIHPKLINVYEKSPGIEYVYCNSTDVGTISWFHQPFSTSNVIQPIYLPYTARTLEIHARNQEFQTGHYWCEVSNRMFQIRSEKMIINRLETTMSIEQLGVSFKIDGKNQIDSSSNRKRRDIGQSPSILSLNEMQDLRMNLATTMNTTMASIQNVTFIGASNRAGDISFVLEGANFALDLSHTQNWDTVTPKKLKDRENLLLRAVLLYYSVNNTLQFKIDNKDVIAVPGSLTSSSLAPKCKDGLVLTENGLTCGACPSGTRYNQNECKPCRKGTYQPSPSQNTCIQCPDRAETLSTGSVSVEYCINPEFLTTESTTTLVTTKATNIKPSTSVPQQAEDDDITTVIIVVIVVVVLALIVAFIMFIVCRRRNRNLQKLNEKPGGNRNNDSGLANPTFNVDDPTIFVEENPYQIVDGDIGTKGGNGLYSTIPDMKAVTNVDLEKKSKNERQRFSNQYEHTDVLAFNNFAFRGESVKSNKESSYDVLNRDNRPVTTRGRPAEKQAKPPSEAYEQLGKKSNHYNQI